MTWLLSIFDVHTQNWQYDMPVKSTSVLDSADPALSHCIHYFLIFLTATAWSSCFACSSFSHEVPYVAVITQQNNGWIE